MDARTTATRYGQAQVTSVDAKRLLLLVFDGGLRFLRQAREALAADDLPQAAEAMRRAHAIVAELQATLDFERGGDIAPTLYRLYDFMLHHLTVANAQRSARHVDEVIAVLEPVAGAFRTIIEPARAA